MTVQRKGASILADDEAPAEGLTEEGVIGDGEGQIVDRQDRAGLREGAVPQRRRRQTLSFTSPDSSALAPSEEP